jgi:hypothetical protein
MNPTTKMVKFDVKTFHSTISIWWWWFLIPILLEKKRTRLGKTCDLSLIFWFLTVFGYFKEQISLLRFVGCFSGVCRWINSCLVKKIKIKLIFWVFSHFDGWKLGKHNIVCHTGWCAVHYIFFKKYKGWLTCQPSF